MDDEIVYSIFGSLSNSSSNDIGVIEEKKTKKQGKSINNKDEKTQINTIPDVKEALNEYFKLKLKYETKINENKKKAG